MHEKLKKIGESKALMAIVYTIGVTVIAFVIFDAGMLVGFNKASFSHSWGEHYMDNFGLGDRQHAGFDGDDHAPNAHGAVGKIISINLPTMIVQDKENTEKVIVLNTDTKIQELRNAIESTDIKIDDFVVVIGAPNEQGQIEAKFIRIIPQPDSLTSPQPYANTN